MQPGVHNQENGSAVSENSAQPASVLSAAVSTVHDVLEKAENAAEPGAGKVSPVVSLLPQSAHAPLSEAVHSAAEAAAALPAKAEGVIAEQQQRFEGAMRYVQEKPLQAVAVAFAAAWMIGRITR
ncbi:MAG: hypothetical protein JWM26_2477 [Betaproteobacteria bacterium]|jgi:ElaB/YqjD/DUF883 family membrane-anchored ribosome-binding protein|nr:hypothetical protein [Betaproteobacteria bacterium]